MTNHKLTLDDHERAPLRLLPSRTNQPPLHFRNQQLQVLWIRAHNLIEFGEFSGAEEDLGHAELEVVLVQTEGFEQRLLRKYTWFIIKNQCFNLD